MSLPYMSDKSIMRPTVRTQFGGLNNNLSARDGEIVWMENMSSREFPLLTPRKPRAYAQTISEPQGIGSRDELYWVSGTGFYYNGVLKGTVEKSRKQFAAMGNMICIFPDKKYYNIGNMGSETVLTGVQFQNGTYAGIPAAANTIYKAGAAWDFNPGDALTISGCSYPENNKTAIVREVNGDYLRFYENTFVLHLEEKYIVGPDGLTAGRYYWYTPGVNEGLLYPTGPGYITFELSENLSEGDYFEVLFGVSGQTHIAINVFRDGYPSSEAYARSWVEEDGGTLLEVIDEMVNYTEQGPVSITRDIPDSFGSLEASQTESNVRFSGGFYAGVFAEANTIYKSGAAWGNNFRPGDAVTISGAPGNNGTYIIREVDGDYLHFYENTLYVPDTYKLELTENLSAGTYSVNIGGERHDYIFSSGVSSGVTLYIGDYASSTEIYYYQNNVKVTAALEVIGGEGGRLLPFSRYQIYEEVTLSRKVPDMDYICVNENRLWGCKGDLIYASALGDPFNFEVFDGLSTDSWQSTVSDEGDFTACVSYGGYPIFFKENSICKVQGDKPSNFQWTIANRFGVKDGSSWSLAIAGETLFYLSRAGICAYNGGTPRIISDALGTNTKWVSGSGGSDGVRYYVSLTDSAENTGLYVYDTRYGVWHREDDVSGAFAFCDESLYMVDLDTGKLWRLDGDTDYGSAEGTITWQVKFADSDNFYETTDSNSQNKKGPLRILIRATLANETTVTVKIKYDDGTTHTVGTLTGTSSEKKKSYIIPLILRRCDHYRLSLDGSGDAVIYSISIEKYSGSQFQASSGVTLPNSNNAN